MLSDAKKLLAYLDPMNKLREGGSDADRVVAIARFFPWIHAGDCGKVRSFLKAYLQAMTKQGYQVDRVLRAGGIVEMFDRVQGRQCKNIRDVCLHRLEALVELEDFAPFGYICPVYRRLLLWRADALGDSITWVQWWGIYTILEEGLRDGGMSGPVLDGYSTLTHKVTRYHGFVGGWKTLVAMRPEVNVVYEKYLLTQLAQMCGYRAALLTLQDFFALTPEDQACIDAVGRIITSFLTFPRVWYLITYLEHVLDKRVKLIYGAMGLTEFIHEHGLENYADIEETGEFPFLSVPSRYLTDPDMPLPPGPTNHQAVPCNWDHNIFG